jgi:hypothetical protein
MDLTYVRYENADWTYLAQSLATRGSISEHGKEVSRFITAKNLLYELPGFHDDIYLYCSLLEHDTV